LKLLLDEHIWPGVAVLLKQIVQAAEVESIHGLRGGRLMNSDDAVILREAHQAGRVLVTFDVNTIPALLQEMAALDDEHSGVIFISAKSFAQNDHNGIARALAEILRDETDVAWTNRVVFLNCKRDG
jgi:predicted nuclease of predicted toxin-antitoxin system